jgi:hypothetical protein
MNQRLYFKQSGTRFHYFFRVIIILLAGLFSGISAPLAGTITVTNSSDNDSGSLRQAIAAAAPGDTINFSAISSVTLTSEQLSVTKNLIIDGGAGIMIQRSSAANIPNFRIFYINPGVTLELRKITIANGKTSDGTGGGGCSVNGGALVLKNCTVSSNATGDEDFSGTDPYPGGHGGGIYVKSGTLTLENTAVTSNTTSKGKFVYDGDNYEGGDGGGIYADASTVILKSSSVSQNTTGTGNYNASSGDGGFGGGICIDGATATIENSTVGGNKTGIDGGFGGEGDGGFGGGIYVKGGVLNLKNTSVSGNITGRGGQTDTGKSGGEGAGIYIGTGSLTLKASTVSANVTGNSAGDGGGIYVGSSGTVIMEHTTVSGNAGAAGGGIYVDSQNKNVKIMNTLLGSNTASTGPDVYGAVTSEDYNLLGNRSGCSIIPRSNDLVGTLDSPISPKVSGLANNGGPTQTCALQAGSPAINAGTCYDRSGNPVTYDQREYHSNDGACDIGAFEYQAPATARVYVKPGGMGDGTSWGNAYGSPRHALDGISAGEIWVAAGTYSPETGTSFQLKNGVTLYGGFSGTENFFSERDLKNNTAVLSGGAPVVSGSGTTNAAVIDGFTITGGTGSGMYNNSGSPTVINCIFTGNSATNGGGMNNNNSLPVVTNCIFKGNSAGSGGGMYNNGSSPKISNCIFYANSATNGGGMYNNSAAPSVSITNSIFWANNGSQISSAASFPIVSHSVVQDEDPDDSNVYNGIGNLDDDPMFVNAAAGDFHLQAGSPAIDMGTSCSGTDLDGTTRPQKVYPDTMRPWSCDIGVYEFIDQPPVLISPVSNVRVYEDSAPTPIYLNGIFSDPDDDPITVLPVSNTNEALLTASIDEEDPELLLLKYQESQYGTAEITIRGTSNLLFTEDTFTVTVNPVNDPPSVANEIEDVEVDEDAPNTTIDLSNVFTDPDSEDDEITIAVKSNSYPSLLIASISETDNNKLILDYQENQYGEATIIIQGTSKGLTADAIFKVTVNPVNDPPIVYNPIKDVKVNVNASNTRIDLSSVFREPDNELLTMSLVSNSNESLVSASVIATSLILDYQDNQYGSATIIVQAESNGETVINGFTVTVKSISVSNISKKTNKQPPLTFSASDFQSHFAGDLLTQIRILSLPVNGLLKLNGQNVTLNQDITVDLLGKLAYYPNTDFFGTDSFSWNGTNGAGFAPAEALVEMTIAIIPGDMDYNGILDLRDVILGLKILSGMPETVFTAADVNEDKKIGMEEVHRVFEELSVP